MSANVFTLTRIADEFATLRGSSQAGLPVEDSPGIQHLRVAAGVEDSLAILRTAVFLARHYGASLIIVLPEASVGRNGCSISGVEVHFGTAPCSALLAGFLSSVEQKLRENQDGFQCEFFVELGPLADSRAFLIRICSACPHPKANGTSRQASAADNPISNRHPTK